MSYVYNFNQIKKGLLFYLVFCITSFVTLIINTFFSVIVKLIEVHLLKFFPLCLTQVIESYLGIWGDGSAAKCALHKYKDLGLDSQHSHKKPRMVVPAQKGRVRDLCDFLVRWSSQLGSSRFSERP